MNNYSNPPENDTPDWDELIGNTQAAKPKKQPKQDYTELATRISNEEGFDPNITLAVMKQESGQRNNAVSPKGASGLMQLMPATAKARGVRDLFDPEQNIRAGVQELKQHYKTNNGDLAKTLASYNWGSGNLQKKGLQNAPKETRDYIKNITSSLGKPINLSSTPEQDSTPDWDELVSGKANTVTTRPRRVTPVQRTSSVKPQQAQPTSKIDWSKIRIDDTKKLPAKTTIASKIASGEKVSTPERGGGSVYSQKFIEDLHALEGGAERSLEQQAQKDVKARNMPFSEKAKGAVAGVLDALPYLDPTTPKGLVNVPNLTRRYEYKDNPGYGYGQAGGNLAETIIASIAAPGYGTALSMGKQAALAEIERQGESQDPISVGSIFKEGAKGATKGAIFSQASKLPFVNKALDKLGGLAQTELGKNLAASIARPALVGAENIITSPLVDVPVDYAYDLATGDDSLSRNQYAKDILEGNLNFPNLKQAAARDFLMGAGLGTGMRLPEAAKGYREGGINTAANRFAFDPSPVQDNNLFNMPGRQFGEQKLLNPSPLDPNYAPTQPLNYSDLARTKPLDYNDLANTIPLPPVQPKYNTILKGGQKPTDILSEFERVTRPTPTQPIDLANKGTERLTSTQPDLQSIALPSTKPQSQGLQRTEALQPLTDTLPFRPLDEVSPYTTKEMTMAKQMQGIKPAPNTTPILDVNSTPSSFDTQRILSEGNQRAMELRTPTTNTLLPPTKDMLSVLANRLWSENAIPQETGINIRTATTNTLLPPTKDMLPVLANKLWDQNAIPEQVGMELRTPTTNTLLPPTKEFQGLPSPIPRDQNAIPEQVGMELRTPTTNTLLPPTKEFQGLPSPIPKASPTSPFSQEESLNQDAGIANQRRQDLRNFFDEQGMTGYMEGSRPAFVSPYDRDPSNGGLPPLSPEFLLNQSANPTGQIPFERRRLANAPVSEKQDFYGQNKLRLPELNKTYPLNISNQTQPIDIQPLPAEAPSYDALLRAGLIKPKRQIQQNETGEGVGVEPDTNAPTQVLPGEEATRRQGIPGQPIIGKEDVTPNQGLLPLERKDFNYSPADTPEAGQTVNPYMDTNYLDQVLGKPTDFNPYQTNEIQPGLSNKEINKIMINPRLQARGVMKGKPKPFYRVLPEQTERYGVGTQEQMDHMSAPSNKTGVIPTKGSNPSRNTKTDLNAPIDRPMVQGGKGVFDPFKYDKNAPSVNLSRPPVTPEQAKIAYDFFKQLENPNEPLAVGKTGELDSPYFDKPIKYNPAIVDLDKILTSHDRYLNERPGFPKEFQPRDRKLSAQAFYGEQGIVPKFKPALLAGESISPAEGRPTIEGRRAEGQQRVISGNKRAMALDMIYNNYPEKVQAYKDYLVNNPPKGMTSEQVKEAIAKSGKPALVNMLKDMPDAELKRFANIANEPNVEEYSPLERARVDADSIDVNKISKIGSTGDLTAKENDSFVQDFINKIATPANRGKLYKNGELTQEGVRRVQNALFVKAFGDSPETLRILSDITESTSADYKNIANALAAKAPRIAQIKELGNASADYDISTDLMKSLNQYANLRKSGLSVDDYIKQQGLDELTSNQKQLLKLFDETKRSPNQLKQTLDTYLDTAQKEVKTNARQESMFGQLGEEKGQVLSDAVNKTVENRAKVKADKAAKKAAREKSLIDKLLSDQSGAIPIGSPLPSSKNLFQKLTTPKSPTTSTPTITPPANQPNLPGIPANQAVKEQPPLKTASSTIKANMLLNPASALGDTIATGGRLVVKNAISDTVRNAVDKQLAKIGQVHEDPNNPGQFIKTGENKRTFISGSAKETWNNFVSGAKGIKDAKNLVLKKGLTPTELQELLQHEIHTKGSSQAGVKGAALRAVDNYVNLAGRVRAAFDEPAYKYALKDATQAELRVQAENSGIPRAQLDTAVQQVKDFQDGKINQITVHPRLRLAAEEILSTAKTNAMYETLRDDNAFSKRFSEFKNKLWEGGKGSQAMAFLLDQAAPFARTGTNIIWQASDMSVGGLYNIQKLTRAGYKQGGFTLKQQASLAKSLGDVAMGSIVAGIGAYAGGKGYAIKNTFFNTLSGENKQERTLNEAANREGGSFQIPFTNRRSTTHILGTGKPIFEFGVAAQKLLSDPETSYEDKAKGIADQILNSALEHPATTATRDLVLAFFGPDKADSLYRQAVTRATTLVMPKFLEQLSRAGGEKRKIDLETEGNIAERFAKDVYNNVRDRLPGRSNYNQPEYTALGDQNKYPSFAVVDPFRSKEERVTPVTKELTKQNVGLNPLQRNKAQGETPQEFAERSRDVGKLTNRQLTDLVTSKTYAELPKLRQSEKIFRDDKTLTDRGLKEEAIKSIEKGSHAGELTYPELSYLPSITSRIDKQIAPLLKNVKKDKLKRFANLGANVGGK